MKDTHRLTERHTNSLKDTHKLTERCLQTHWKTHTNLIKTHIQTHWEKHTCKLNEIHIFADSATDIYDTKVGHKLCKIHFRKLQILQSCQPPTEGKLAKHEIAQHKVMRKLISSIVGVSHNAQVDNESTQMGSTHREWRWGGGSRITTQTGRILTAERQMVCCCPSLRGSKPLGVSENWRVIVSVPSIGRDDRSGPVCYRSRLSEDSFGRQVGKSKLSWVELENSFLTHAHTFFLPTHCSSSLHLPSIILYLEASKECKWRWKSNQIKQQEQ